MPKYLDALAGSVCHALAAVSSLLRCYDPDSLHTYPSTLRRAILQCLPTCFGSKKKKKKSKEVKSTIRSRYIIEGILIKVVKATFRHGFADYHARLYYKSDRSHFVELSPDSKSLPSFAQSIFQVTSSRPRVEKCLIDRQFTRRFMQKVSSQHTVFIAEYVVC